MKVEVAWENGGVGVWCLGVSRSVGPAACCCSRDTVVAVTLGHTLSVVSLRNTGEVVGAIGMVASSTPVSCLACVSTPAPGYA